MDTVSKPPELLALHDVTEELFDTLQSWFDVPAEVALDLSDIDSAVAQLADPVAVAALAMRKLQALRLLAQPGVRTSTDVVVTIVQDLDRALVQAPTMHLQRTAASADWDAELADLLGGGTDAGGSDAGPVPLPVPGSEDDDPVVTRFRELHGRLHAAARAVVEASDGEIRYLV
ncbi:MAG: hypothetical protein WEB09_05265 [Nitriliruptor sp.]